MLSGVVASRYASALFELASETGALDRTEQDLAFVTRLLKQTPELMELLTHPKVGHEKKKVLIENLFAKEVSQTVLNFLKVLLDQGREAYVYQINEQYVELVDQAQGRVKVHVESAMEMSESELADITNKLQQMSGKKVTLTTTVNPGLVGGVRMRFGDKVVDASVKGLLENFRESLNKQQVS